MVPYNRETLFRVAQWTLTSKHKTCRKIRELAETDEMCTLILTELYRIGENLRDARAHRADATLTLVDWFNALEYFQWRCAYCQLRPFEILHHFLPQDIAGTTPENCVPACRHCKSTPTRNNIHVWSYIDGLQEHYPYQQR